MKTSSSTTRRRHLDRWRRRGAALTLAAGVLVAGVLATLTWLGGTYRATHPVEALVDAGPPGPATALRVLLLVATAVTAGVGLARLLLGSSAASTEVDGLPRGVRAVAWVGGLAAAAACAGAALAGLASRPLGAFQLVVSVAVPLLLASARLVVPVSVLLVGLLAVVLGAGRSGLPLVLDVTYAVTGAVLLGASVLGVALFRREGEPPARVARVAMLAGVLASVAGVGQLLLTGPRGRYDLLHTGYGLASLAQAALPLLATVLWFLARRPATRPRAAELTRLAAGGVALAFAGTAVLGTLPRPAAAPVPGHPLLRPVDLPFRHLAVQVMPMRPGPNLVHIGPAEVRMGSAAPHGRQIDQHHGAPEPAEEALGALTVSAGGSTDGTANGTPVPLASRPGASGEWAVLDIPAGATELTVTGDGFPVTVPIDVGTEPAPTDFQRALAGPDGPECASAALGELVAPVAELPDGAELLRLSAGRAIPPQRFPAADGAAAVCPAQELTSADAAALRDTVVFLAGRGIPAVHLVGDDSPRAVAAADLVRAEAAKARLPISATPASGTTVLVVSGWARAAGALKEATDRAVGEATGGIVLAPWLLAGGVLGEASSEVVALTFNPQESDPRQYATTVAAVFPGERPSSAGYLAWARRTGVALDARVAFYGAAPVDVPMGIPMDHGVNPADWYPDGTVVLINPPLGPAAGNP